MSDKEKRKNVLGEVSTFILGDREAQAQLNEYLNQITPWLESKFKYPDKYFLKTISDIQSCLLKVAQFETKCVVVALPLLITFFLFFATLAICVLQSEIRTEVLKTDLFIKEILSIGISQSATLCFKFLVQHESINLENEEESLLNDMRREGMKNISSVPRSKKEDLLQYIIQTQQRVEREKIIKNELFITEEGEKDTEYEIDEVQVDTPQVGKTQTGFRYLD